MKGRFSKRAKRHKAESEIRTEQMIKDAARRSGPVKVSYLPGSEPPPLEPEPAFEQRTKYPFTATINGVEVTVWPDWIEWPR